MRCWLGKDTEKICTGICIECGNESKCDLYSCRKKKCERIEDCKIGFLNEECTAKGKTLSELYAKYGRQPTIADEEILWESEQ